MRPDIAVRMTTRRSCAKLPTWITTAVKRSIALCRGSAMSSGGSARPCCRRFAWTTSSRRTPGGWEGSCSSEPSLLRKSGKGSGSEPFARDSRPLDPRCLETLLALSGGSPALVTYGLERLWGPAYAQHPRFGTARSAHFAIGTVDFLRAIRASVSSQRGRPQRAVEGPDVSRRAPGRSRARAPRCLRADGRELVAIDPEPALDSPVRRGLISIEGSPLADPVTVLPSPPSSTCPRAPPQREAETRPSGSSRTCAPCSGTCVASGATSTTRTGSSKRVLSSLIGQGS